ncbi:hypothetical protein KIH39_13070 [Telmatocola sphagniphila]|uniref:Uncharacterized protein n=1 Tax=Telmatocola sphagniphila TaxID=1123043 RepID=A0A8E6BAB5_9BACT|nr:hypothetical protein [Telmatocola sphagniphila]QVL34797.1 hypothetical protein KIH39_13070 [Telmatocola sphagniphila]
MKLNRTSLSQKRPVRRFSALTLSTCLLLSSLSWADEKPPAAILLKPQAKSKYVDPLPLDLSEFPGDVKPASDKSIPSLITPDAGSDPKTIPAKLEDLQPPPTKPKEETKADSAPAKTAFELKPIPPIPPKTTPGAPALIPSSTNISTKDLLNDYPPIRDIQKLENPQSTPATPLTSSVTKPATSPVTTGMPKPNSVVPVEEGFFGKGMGIAQTRWSIYEERMGGNAPIQLLTNGTRYVPPSKSELAVPNQPTQSQQTIVVVESRSNGPAADQATGLKAPVSPPPPASTVKSPSLGVILTQSEPQLPPGMPSRLPDTVPSVEAVEVAKPAVALPKSAPVAGPRQSTFLPGTLVPSSGGGILTSPEIVLPEVKAAETKSSSSVLELPKVSKPAVVESHTFSAITSERIAEPSINPTAVLKSAPSDWTAVPEKDRPEARVITAPVGQNRVIGSPTASPAQGNRALAIFQADDRTVRWQPAIEPTAPQPSAAAANATRLNNAAADIAKRPAQESKVIPASMTSKPQPSAPEVLPALNTTYTLMPWQWVEKIRTVAGPSAQNLVALVSNKGEVKIKFDCRDATEAQAIAGRISSIAEFRKLSIDFEINAH